VKFIRSIRKIEPARHNGKTIVYMLGYGGRIWQAKRHLNLLKSRGYKLLAMDFVDVLRQRNAQDLVGLMDEVSGLLEKEGLVSRQTILVGVSLGGLVGYNLIRKYPQLDKLLVITGGDMTHIPTARSLKKHWRLSRAELAARWKDVNIYTPVGNMRNRHVVMLLPKRDMMIDPDEVAREIAKHTHLNDFTIVPTNGGHFRTIITETIISPRKSLPYIERLANLS
jgi:pimeloyl-ACP methyl ester carboxylesterase